MSDQSLSAGNVAVVQPGDLQPLFDSLSARGFRVIGPTLAEGSIVYDELESASQLPRGWGEVQDAGKYRLEQRGTGELFGFATIPQSWKRYLNPPEQRISTALLKDAPFRAFEMIDEPLPAEKLAFFGVRPCDLRAIMKMDRVFMGGPYVDPAYKARRENSLIIAVDCSHPGGTCFCASMGTGPRAESGCDLTLTEVWEEGKHFLLARAGTEVGAALLADVPHKKAESKDLAAAQEVVERAAGQMKRSVQTEGLKELLAKSYESPIWEQTARRCLACGNCTMVCPTCFCSNVEDVTDLSGTRAERWRKWDSCFNVDFSYIHGGSLRTSLMSRYRQWMMHKLSAWEDQFGEAGCVGCGRCITWCPVGIDITQQANSIQTGVA